MDKKENELVVIERKTIPKYCLSCGKKLKNPVRCDGCNTQIIIPNSFRHYLSEISTLSSRHDEILIKFIMRHQVLAESIIFKKKFEGWEETGNRTMRLEGKDNRLEVINVTLKKVPILQGIRQNLKR